MKIDKRKRVCFAYYSGNKFLGWYSDSFGTVTKNSPKIYGYSKEQIAVIRKNLSSKLKDKSFSEVLSKINPIAGKLVENSKERDKNILSNKDIYLRIIECPYYDGPNPEFNREDYKKDPENYSIESWIYADYSKVKEWASKEPDIFIDYIKTNE